jgi:hypothetical protein
VRSFQIGEIGEISFPADRSLHGDQVGKRADWRLHAIDLPRLRSCEQILELEPGDRLGNQVEVSQGSCEMDAAIWGDAVVGYGRTVWARRSPPRYKGLDSGDVLGSRVEDSIDVPGCAHDAVANQCDAPDQDVAHFGLVEVFENAGEAGHCDWEASSMAVAERAMPSFRSSSGSRVASLIKRYRRHSAAARRSSPWLSARFALFPASWSLCWASMRSRRPDLNRGPLHYE